jgi:deoxyhypusine synthase
MNKDYNIERLDFSKIKTYSIDKRENKADINKMAGIINKGSSISEFIDALPNYLKAKDLSEISEHITNAYKNEKPLILGMGAHPIKVGLSPLIISLIKKGIIKGILMNGAGVIHDFEIAYQGETSEDVAKGLEDGSFGMVEETGRFIHTAIKKREGFGYSVGKYIDEQYLDNKEYSILWNAYKQLVPVCVSVAIGNDIIHQHPLADGEDIGYNSYEDFKIFTSLIPSMNKGGVFLNLGSAVIIPETFLKALTIARNIKKEIKDFYTANFDMIQHYRPNVNIVSRPTLNSGKGYSITGHHEIMFPLLYAMIIEKLDS